jgi:uncharacterized RDD family membrane protein YckC
MPVDHSATVIEKAQPPSQKPGGRANDQIVEAALLRARRASENASRAVPASESPSPTGRSTTKTTPAVEREATARALAPTEEVKPRSEIVPLPVPKVAQQPGPVSIPEKEARTPVAYRSLTEPVEVQPTQTVPEVPFDELPAGSPIDDIEPRDYLTAEIKKVDRELSEQFAHNESPGLFAHVVLNVVDFLAISLSCAPFLALIEIYNGNLFDRATQIAAAAIIVVVTLFYLGLTQTVCGKTFGMMLTNTRIVDALTFETPSPQRALVRSAAYFLATLPALIGMLWLLLNRKRRGWHDYLSGTMIARDF